MHAPAAHFVELRSRINERLRRLRTDHADSQINDFPWLYGALGKVPASVMFICENPSIAGVRGAHMATLDHGPPDIEAQWCGGPRDPARTRFRHVLATAGLKSTSPLEKGGWLCYITNVVKEANIASDQRSSSQSSRHSQAEQWADVLTWELEEVSPDTVFCVGSPSFKEVRWLQRRGLIPPFDVHQIIHYSARGTHEAVMGRMLREIETVMKTDGVQGGSSGVRQGPRNDPTRVQERRASRDERMKPVQSGPATGTLGDLIPHLWSRLPDAPGRRSKLLHSAILRRPQYGNRNPRDESKKGAGYRAFEVAIGGITTEEYLATLEELWRRKPMWTQREKKPDLWKHLTWDLRKGFVSLADYDDDRVRRARAASRHLPALESAPPAGYELVRESLLDEILTKARL